MFYPVFLNLKGKAVVVIGGGEIGQRKVESLLEAEAAVTVVAPESTERLNQLAEQEAIVLARRQYIPADIQNAFLAICATDDPAVQSQVWSDARSLGVLVNTVDEAQMCDFIMPAVVKQGEVLVAIGTGGTSPALAAWLRRRITETVTPNVGRVAAVLGSIRPEVKQRLPGADERKQFYKSVIDSGILQWIDESDDAAAKARVERMLDGVV